MEEGKVVRLALHMCGVDVTMTSFFLSMLHTQSGGANVG
jgi:hypothetical protein